MLLRDAHADYSPIAGFYHRHWCAHYHEWVLATLDDLLLRGLPVGAHILDVCCGTGTIMQALAARRYVVTGVDACEAMVRYARTAVPGGRFVVADVREFRLDTPVDAALSTFDSLNHVLSDADLLRVFGNVYGALRDGGRFVFDLTVEAAYETEWRQTCSIVEPDEACFIRGVYDPDKRLGSTYITLFELDGVWRRADVTLLQRCHETAQVHALLRQAGFSHSVAYDADADLKLEGKLAVGRRFFVAIKAGMLPRAPKIRDTDANGALSEAAVALCA